MNDSANSKSSPSKSNSNPEVQKPQAQPPHELVFSIPEYVEPEQIIPIQPQSPSPIQPIQPETSFSIQHIQPETPVFIQPPQNPPVMPQYEYMMENTFQLTPPPVTKLFDLDSLKPADLMSKSE